LVFLQPKIRASHQYLKDLHWFEAIFKIFACAVFEAIKVKGLRSEVIEVATSKFCNHFQKFGCQPQKGKADLCMTNGSKDLIYLSFFVPQRPTLVSNAKRKISKSNKSELWNRLSYRGLPYLFKMRSQTFRNNWKILRSQPH